MNLMLLFRLNSFSYWPIIIMTKIQTILLHLDTLTYLYHLFFPVTVAQSCPTLCDPTDYTVHGILQARILEWVAVPFFKGSSQPRIGTEPRFPTLQADSLPAELPGKPKNTGVGSLSLLQQISPTEESNQDLLHSRWILYQLRYQSFIFIS